MINYNFIGHVVSKGSAKIKPMTSVFFIANLKKIMQVNSVVEKFHSVSLWIPVYKCSLVLFHSTIS